jgi:hypothetical protein
MISSAAEIIPVWRGNVAEMKKRCAAEEKEVELTLDL